MSAESWPRRRRVAGFARGSASGGAVPIIIGDRRRSSLSRDILTQALAAGLLIPHEDGDAARITLADGTVVARITRESDLLVRLTPALLSVLREGGWIAEEAAGLARVRGPRTAPERDVAWRILLAARDAAEDARSAEASAPEKSVAPLLPAHAAAPAPAM